MSSSISIDEFVAGVMSSMKLSQRVELSMHNIEEELVDAFRLLEQVARRKGVELRFHCSLNAFTGRALTVHYALVRAEQSGLLVRDGQFIEISLTTAESADIINASPLSLTEWKTVTKHMRSDAFSNMPSPR